MTPFIWFTLALTGIACIVGFVFGQRPERLAAAAVAVETSLAFAVLEGPLAAVKPAMLVIDLALLLWSAFLVMRYRRRWLPIFAALVLLTVGTHLTTVMDLRLGFFAYATALNIWWDIAMVALVLGCWLEAAPERRRLRALAAVS